MEGIQGPEANTLLGCLRGEEGAWRELLATYYPLVSAIFRRVLARKKLPHEGRTVDEETAAFFGDLCLRRDQTLGRFRGEGSLRAYLAVLAVNYIRRRARELRREEQHLQEYSQSMRVQREASELGESSPDADRKEVSWAVARCSAKERLLFQLLYVDGAAAEAASSALGISRETLYLRKHRFHQKVSSFLKERSAGRAASPSCIALPAPLPSPEQTMDEFQKPAAGGSSS